MVARTLELLRLYRSNGNFMVPFLAPALDESGKFYVRGQRPKEVALGPAELCMFNSLTAVVANPGLTYAEGFALTDDNKLFHHAWVVDSAGLAIDVTIPDDVEVAYFGVALKNPVRAKASWPLQTLVRQGGPYPDPLTEEQLQQRERGLPT